MTYNERRYWIPSENLLRLKNIAFMAQKIDDIFGFFLFSLRNHIDEHFDHSLHDKVPFLVIKVALKLWCKPDFINKHIHFDDSGLIFLIIFKIIYIEAPNRMPPVFASNFLFSIFKHIGKHVFTFEPKFLHVWHFTCQRKLNVFPSFKFKLCSIDW